MAENCKQQSKTGTEKLQYVTKELQHVCKSDSDDNDVFFESSQYFDADETTENTTIKTSVESETAGQRDKAFFSKENTGKLSNESARAFTDSSWVKSDEENQCIDIKYANGSSQKVSTSSHKYGQEPLILYSRKAGANTIDAYQKSFHHTSDGDRSLALTSFSFQENEKDKEDTLEVGGRFHRREEISQHGRETRDGPSFERSDSCTDACPKHCDEIIKYVCITCDTLACQVCITIEHKNCDSHEFIPSFITKPDFCFENKCIQFEGEMNQIQKRLTLNKKKINANLKGCETLRDKAKVDFKKQRDEINKLFECIEKDFDRRIWQIENSDKEKMRLLMLKQEELEKVFKRQAGDYYRRRNAGQRAGVFTKIKMSREETDDMMEELEKLETDNSIRRYIYSPSKLVTTFMKKVSDLGNIEDVDSSRKRSVTDTTKINIRGEADRNACKISGLDFLSEHLLVAVDFGNSSVKVIDLCSYQVLTAMTMTSEPFDVTVVRDDQSPDNTNVELVVTLPGENKIRFLQFTVPGSFSVRRDAQANGQCRGIIYSDCKLFLTFPAKGKIEIIDMQGQLLKRITTETIGQIFRPQFIAMDTEQSTIFVSDNENHSVINMTLDGEVKAIYTDYDLIQPRGLCVNTTGAVFVCSFGSQKVHHLSDCCETISTMSIADKEHPAPYPFSIAYSDKKHALYVGQFTMDCVKAYKLG